MPKKDYLIIDIETYADLDKVDMLPEPSISKVLKDEAKIAIAKEEARQAQIEKMALSPYEGRIACIGYCQDGISQVDVSDEKDMLRIFFERISDKHLITFNGISFDIPFIYKRAMLLGVKPSVPFSFLTKKYDNPFHYDLMMLECNQNKQEAKSLDYLARLALGESKVEFNFREIPELLKTEKGKEKLKEYCSKDVELTYKLFKLFEGVII